MASVLSGRKMLHVNSTAAGGGVAELLTRMVPLFKDIGLDVRWEVMQADRPFFEVTKNIHNSLQGRGRPLSREMWEEYARVNRENAERIDLDADFVVIHDPQPAMFIDHKKRGTWIWRCHIDISSPDRAAWHQLKDIVEKFDGSIFSVANFAQSLPIHQFLIQPTIDPLAEKNIHLEDEEVRGIYGRLGVPLDKPVLLQVSRFDPFKDPLGVIEAYKLAKKYHDCRLVLAGGTATDDPEGEKVLAEVEEKAAGDPDIHILLLPPFSDREVNALQRGADIVLQKSTREGFGLVVAEALWKKKPVIAGDAGGIPLQVIEGVTGFLVHSVEGTAYRIRQLLENPERAAKMGEAGREHIRRNFLTTRNIRNYLGIWTALERRDEKVIYI
ncbi:MAG: glycosyltransferase [Deltaproteobacteria bacterium]|nr:glycosyltransferase [Deltaproteobacteria bacterium]MCL4873739.1 glycosyltransferase [bacterium]